MACWCCRAEIAKPTTEEKPKKARVNTSIAAKEAVPSTGELVRAPENISAGHISGKYALFWMTTWSPQIIPHIGLWGKIESINTPMQDTFMETCKCTQFPHVMRVYPEYADSQQNHSGLLLRHRKFAAEKPMKGKKTFPNGFVIENVAMGDPAGKLAKAGKKVLVKYVGKLQKTGKVFDQTKGSKPFAFRLGVNEVIKG